MCLYLLLPHIQVLVLPTVESSISKTLRHKIKDLDACTSNIYGVPECILLTWLNHHYEEQYPVLFPDSGMTHSHFNTTKINIYTTELSEHRYIKSFEVDLMDSIVLACVMIAYIPYLVSPSIYITVWLCSLCHRHPSIINSCIHFLLQLNSVPTMLLF